MRGESGAAVRLDRWRYLRVARFFAAAFLAVIWWDLILRRVPGIRGLARRSALDRWRQIARRFRWLAVQMGGVLIKLGQFLSIRVDILPQEVTSELTGLQDEVPPESFDDINAVIAQEFGRASGAVFGWVASHPEAAASLAQVHRARLPGGEEVVVKVQRPRIGQMVETDLAAIRLAITWLKLYRPVARRVDLDRLFSEFADTTRRELDFINEGRNAEHFARDFAADPGIYIARVYWEYTTQRVLTLENVASIKITDFSALEAAGISRAEVARRLYDTYLEQIFAHNFVHADPHPGNLFVRPLAGSAGASTITPDVEAATGRPYQLIFVDFGMVAAIPEQLRAALREYLIALGLRDAHRVVAAYVDAGLLLPGADLRRLEALHEDMFRRMAGVRMGQLRDMALAQAEYVFREYRDIIQEMPFQLPADLLFVGRALGILSGLATSLDPDFDPWTATIPFAERLATEEGGDGVRAGLEEVADLARLALSLPARMDRFLRRAERGELLTQTALAPDAERAVRRLERAVDRLAWAVIFAGTLLGGAYLRVDGRSDLLATLLFLGAGFSLLWSLTRR